MTPKTTSLLALTLLCASTLACEVAVASVPRGIDCTKAITDATGNAVDKRLLTDYCQRAVTDNKINDTIGILQQCRSGATARIRESFAACMDGLDTIDPTHIDPSHWAPLRASLGLVGWDAGSKKTAENFLTKIGESSASSAPSPATSSSSTQPSGAPAPSPATSSSSTQPSAAPAPTRPAAGPSGPVRGGRPAAATPDPVWGAILITGGDLYPDIPDDLPATIDPGDQLPAGFTPKKFFKYYLTDSAVAPTDKDKVTRIERNYNRWASRNPRAKPEDKWEEFLSLRAGEFGLRDPHIRPAPAATGQPSAAPAPQSSSSSSSAPGFSTTPAPGGGTATPNTPAAPASIKAIFNQLASTTDDLQYKTQMLAPNFFFDETNPPYPKPAGLSASEAKNNKKKWKEAYQEWHENYENDYATLAEMPTPLQILEQDRNPYPHALADSTIHSTINKQGFESTWRANVQAKSEGRAYFLPYPANVAGGVLEYKRPSDIVKNTPEEAENKRAWYDAVWAWHNGGQQGTMPTPKGVAASAAVSSTSSPGGAQSFNAWAAAHSLDQSHQIAMRRPYATVLGEKAARGDATPPSVDEVWAEAVRTGANPSNPPAGIAPPAPTGAPAPASSSNPSAGAPGPFATQTSPAQSAPPASAPATTTPSPATASGVQQPTASNVPSAELAKIKEEIAAQENIASSGSATRREKLTAEA
ncbi:MAG: hypothetical protein C0514_06790, partial [Candidatus Puniceispirillum sp.]|nr:hypothetical protein [Candidatus Puniceispirillum sp.]